jgi:hypothetical protein
VTDESGTEESLWGELLGEAGGPLRVAINGVLGDIDGESRDFAELAGRGLEFVTNAIDAVLERVLVWAFTPERSQQDVARMERVLEIFDTVFEEVARRWLVPALLDRQQGVETRERDDDRRD